MTTLDTAPLAALLHQLFIDADATSALFRKRDAAPGDDGNQGRLCRLLFTREGCPSCSVAGDRETSVHAGAQLTPGRLSSLAPHLVRRPYTLPPHSVTMGGQAHHE
jgi:hypothetical protein